ncbi:MAG: 2,3-butanediol dehydrogenase [Solirubrobacterales bacterium]|nr:2,3-butanediol dehydrogenase [Solirubrobacterales bacterium]
MRAAVYHGPMDIQIEDLPEPDPGPGEVKIKVAHNGVCGSDLHEYFSRPTFTPVDPHPLTGAQIPVVLGHEFAGTIADAGDGVDGFAAGDPVAIRPNYFCGQCPACKLGLTNICRQLAFHGLSGPGGGLADYTVVKSDMVHSLGGVAMDLGATVEPMAVSLHAVARSDLAPGDTTIIAGAGPIGIGLWFALQARGITDVIVSEPGPKRRAAMKALGAPHVIDPRETDLIELAMEVSAGVGAHTAFDAAGASGAIADSVGALAPRGKVVVVGIHESDLAGFNPTSLLLQETEIVGSIIYDDADFQAVIAAMDQGLYTTDGWVEHAPLDDLLGVFDALRAGEKTKVVIDL